MKEENIGNNEDFSSLGESFDYIKLLNMINEDERIKNNFVLKDKVFSKKNFTSEDKKEKLFESQKCSLIEEVGENSVPTVTGEEGSFKLHLIGKDKYSQLELVDQRSNEKDIGIKEEDITTTIEDFPTAEELCNYVNLLNEETVKIKKDLYEKKLHSNMYIAFEDVDTRNVNETILFGSKELFHSAEEKSDYKTCNKQENSLDGEKNMSPNKESDLISKKPQETELNGKIKKNIVEKWKERRRFACAKCGKSFDQQSYLVQHLRSIHGILELHKGESTFSNELSLARHSRLIHKKVHHKCSQCKMTFASKESLSMHFKIAHEKKLRHKCSLCDKAFKLKYHLITHVQSVHKKFKPFKCNKCDHAFSRKDKLHDHVQSIHEKLRHKCLECGKAFIQNRWLRMHSLSVHKKMQNYKCTECENEFTLKYFLNIHIKAVHEKLRQHVCSTCGKAFSSKDSLNNHMQSIHAKLRHECSKCERTFSQRTNLIRHFRLAHDNFS